MQTTNAITASSFFIAALVTDALTAREVAVDAPSSLRGTSLTLVMLFASPVIIQKEIGVYGWLQRPTITALLFAAAFGGLHEGGAMTRAFDSFFLTIVCVIAVLVYSLGGVDETTKSLENAKKQERVVSTSSCMLSGSLLLYSNLRILRAAMRHPSETREFGVPIANSTDFVRGYAFSSDVATVSCSFGAALGIGAAFVMVVHVKNFAQGTGAVALQLGVAGVFQLLSAFSASLSTGQQILHLPVLFAEMACTSTVGGCQAAQMSRRFSTTNTPVAGLWLSAIGLLALAFPPALRLNSAADVARANWSVVGMVFSSSAGIAAFLIIVSNLRFGSYVDAVLILTLFSIIWSSFIDSWSGCIFYIAGFIWDEVVFVQTFGINVALSHATHVILYFNAGLLLLHVLFVGLSRTTGVRFFELWTGAVTIAGTSVATALFTASACLVAGYGGQIDAVYNAVDGPPQAARFCVQHFIPVIVWAPLFSCRCEINLLSRTTRALVWVLSVPVAVAAYAIVLLILGTAPPIVNFFDTWALTGSIFGAGVLPWLATSIV